MQDLKKIHVDFRLKPASLSKAATGGYLHRRADRTTGTPGPQNRAAGNKKSGGALHLHKQSNKTKTTHAMKKIHRWQWTALLVAAALLVAGCGSSVNMHKHKRADCDCPRFD